MATIDTIAIDSQFDPAGFSAGLAESQALFERFLARTAALSAPVVLKFTLTGVTEAIAEVESIKTALASVHVDSVAAGLDTTAVDAGLASVESKLLTLPPISLPVTLDLAGVEAALAAVRTEVAAFPPVVIPISLSGEGLQATLTTLEDRFKGIPPLTLSVSADQAPLRTLTRVIEGTTTALGELQAKLATPVTFDATHAIAVMEDLRRATLALGKPITLTVAIEGDTGALTKLRSLGTAISPAGFTEFGDAAIAALGRIEVAITGLTAALKPLGTAASQVFGGIGQAAGLDAAALDELASKATLAAAKTAAARQAAFQAQQGGAQALANTGLTQLQTELDALSSAFLRGKATAEDYAAGVASIRAVSVPLQQALTGVAEAQAQLNSALLAARATYPQTAAGAEAVAVAQEQVAVSTAQVIAALQQFAAREENSVGVTAQLVAQIEALGLAGNTAAAGLNGANRAAGVHAGAAAGAARADLTLRSSLVVLAAQATGTSSTLARLAESFLLFGGGQAAVVASFGAILVAATIYEVLTKHIQEARKATEDFVKSQAEAARSADAVGKVREAFAGVDEPGGRKIEGLSQRLARLNKDLAEVSKPIEIGLPEGVVTTHEKFQSAIDVDIQKIHDLALAAKQVGLAFLDPILAAQRSAADQATNSALEITKAGIARRQDALKAGFARELVSQDQFFAQSRANVRRAGEADLAALEAQLSRAQTAFAHASSVGPSGQVSDPAGASRAGAEVALLRAKIELQKESLRLGNQQSHEDQAAQAFALTQANAQAALQSLRLAVADQPALLIPIQVDIAKSLQSLTAARDAIAQRIQHSIDAGKGGSDQDKALLAQAEANIRTAIELPTKIFLDSVGALGTRLSALQGIAQATREIANQGVDRPETINEVAAREAALAPILDQIKDRYRLITKQIESQAIPQRLVNDALREQAELARTISEHRAPTAIEVSLLGPVTEAARDLTEARDQLTLALSTGVGSTIASASAGVVQAQRDFDNLTSIAGDLATALGLSGAAAARFVQELSKAGAVANPLLATQTALHTRTQALVGALGSLGTTAAQSFGRFRSEISTSIGSVLGLVDALDKVKLADEHRAAAATPQQIGDAKTEQLIAGLGEIGAAFAGFQAAIGLLGSLFGQSAVEARDQQIRLENSARIRELTVAIRESTLTTTAEGQLRVGKAALQLAPQTAKFNQDFGDLLLPGEKTLFQTALEATGVSLAELEAIAKANGITLFHDGQLTSGALEAVAAAAGITAESLTHLTNSLADQRLAIDTQAKLDHRPGATSDEEARARLERTRQFQLDNLKLSDAEENRVRSIDLSTKAGQEAFRAWEKTLRDRAAAGQLTAEELHNFDVHTVFGPINDAADALNELADSAAAARKQFNDFNIPQGFRRAALAFENSNTGPDPLRIPAPIPVPPPDFHPLSPLPPGVQVTLDRIAGRTPPDLLTGVEGVRAATAAGAPRIIEQLAGLTGAAIEGPRLMVTAIDAVTAAIFATRGPTTASTNSATDPVVRPTFDRAGTPSQHVTVTFGDIVIHVSGEGKNAQQIAEETVKEFRRLARAQSGDTLQFGLR